MDIDEGKAYGNFNLGIFLSDRDHAGANYKQQAQNPWWGLHSESPEIIVVPLVKWPEGNLQTRHQCLC
jgi:hypothetical protein